MIDLLIKVIAGVIVAALCFLARTYYLRWRNKRGILTGRWKQLIKEPYYREDIVECNHSNDNTIKGKIERLLPESENSKAWKFRGRKKDGFIFMTFWNVNDSLNPESSGTIQLHMHDASHLEGFYVKSVTKPDSKKIDTIVKEMEITHLSWIRTK